jgi:DNA-binding NarL/FixJ family response regulator
MQYLERATSLNSTDAEIVAWSELGYSSAGIAKKADLGESTVKAHLKEIADKYGERAIYALRPDQLALEGPLGGEGR